MIVVVKIRIKNKNNKKQQIGAAKEHIGTTFLMRFVIHEIPSFVTYGDRREQKKMHGDTIPAVRKNEPWPNGGSRRLRTDDERKSARMVPSSQSDVGVWLGVRIRDTTIQSRRH